MLHWARPVHLAAQVRPWKALVPYANSPGPSLPARQPRAASGPPEPAWFRASRTTARPGLFHLARHRVPALDTGFPRSTQGSRARQQGNPLAAPTAPARGAAALALTRWVRAAARWRQRRGGPSASAAVQGRDWAWQQSFGRVCALQFANIPSVGTEPDRGSASLVGFVASAQRRVANPCCPPCRPPCASSSSLF